MKRLSAPCEAPFAHAADSQETKINPVTGRGNMKNLKFLAAALLAASGSVHAARVAELEYIARGTPNISLTDGPDPNSVALCHGPISNSSATSS